MMAAMFTWKKKSKDKSIYWQVLGTACVAAVLFLLLCAIRDLFPLGDGSILMVDLHSQYTPLLYRFYDVVTGQKNLFMDFHVSGGANLYADTINEVINPFNYLLFLFGRDRIYLTVNVLLGVYVAAAAVSANFFLLQLWPDKRQYNMALSLVYGFSGFAAYQFQIIKWMIFPVIFPLFVLALKRLVEEKKGGWYAVLLAYQLMLNLQLGIMSLFAVLFGSGIYFYFCVKKEERKRAMCQLAVYTILGVAVSAVVLWPGVFYLLNSARGGENSSYFGVMKQHGLDDLFERLFLTVHPALLGMFLFSLGKGIAGYKKGVNRWKVIDAKGKFLIVWNLLLLITVIAQPSNLLWHLGSYMCFPVRYAYIVLLAGICLLKWQYAEHGEQEKIEKPQSFVHILHMASGFAAVIFCVMAMYLTLREGDQITQAFSTLAISRVCPSQTLLVCLILGMLTMAGLLALFAGKGKQIILTTVACTSSLCLFMCILLPQDYAVRLMNEEAYETMNEQLVDSSDPFIRMPDDADLPLNAALITGGNTLTGYFPAGSQMIYAKGLEQLGYLTPWVSTRSWGGTMISDGILGVNKEETEVISGKALILKDSAELLIEGTKKAADEGALSLQSYLGKVVSSSEVLNCVDASDVYSEEDNCLQLSLKGEQAVYLDAGYPTASITVLVNGTEVEIPEKNTLESPHRLLYLGTFVDQHIQIQILDQSGVMLSEYPGTMELGLLDVAAWKAALENAAELDIHLNHRDGNMQLDVSQVKAGQTIFVPVAAIDGWECLADGKKVEISPILGGFMGITLMENTDTLEISFTPPGFKMGLIVSAATVLCLILCHVLSGKTVQNKVEKGMAVCYKIVWITGFLLVYIVPNIGLVCYMVYKIFIR